MSIKKTNRELRSEEVKNHIVFTARQLFSEYGYKKVSVRDIAEQAGVTTGSLYYYFKNKDEILEAAYETDVPELKEKIAERVREGRDEILLYYFFNELMVEQFRADGIEFTTNRYFERQKYWDRGTDFYNLVYVLIEQAAQVIRFRQDLSLEEITDYLILVFRGTAIKWTRIGDSFDLNTNMKWNIELAMRGLTE